MKSTILFDDIKAKKYCRSSSTLRKSTEVVCKDMNPEPDWRLLNGDLLPDCRKDVSIRSSGEEMSYGFSNKIIFYFNFYLMNRLLDR